MHRSTFQALRAAILLLIAALLAAPSLTAAQEAADSRWDPARFAESFTLTEIVNGLSRPTGIVDPGDGSGRLFIVEQTGTIQVLESGSLLDEPFLDLSDQVSGGSEQGLLGLTFHPDFAGNGQFFVDYTDLNGDTVVARYQITGDDPNLAARESAEQLLFVDQPYTNHNGGDLAFGPDGYLYIALGDGGSQGDPNGNGQNPDALLGSILRIDVDGPAGDLPYGIPEDNPFADGADGAPEVYVYGLRNPWRFSFDRDTGDLYIADVGQNAIEEVTMLPAGEQAGANLGWNILEGSSCYQDADCDPEGTILPVTEYSHDFGCSVTGGYVVRGGLIPALEGVYFFADYCTGLLWGTARDGAGAWQTSDPVETGLSISSFGQGPDGEVYVVDLGGAVYQVVA
jgi:glucose/arabinose dehydrogenase